MPNGGDEDASKNITATAFLYPGSAWLARMILGLGRLVPSVTLHRLYHIHVAEWSTARVRVQKRWRKKAVLAFVVNHNTGADDYIASFALFVRQRINLAFLCNKDWKRVATTRSLTKYVTGHIENVLEYRYAAYGHATVTQIIRALATKPIWDRLVNVAYNRPDGDFQRELQQAIREYNLPLPHYATFWAHVHYILKNSMRTPKWASSTFWIPVPPQNIAGLKAALASLPNGDASPFTRIPGIHYANFTLVDKILDGYPTRGKTELRDLHKPVLVFSVQHDGSSKSLLQRLRAMDGSLQAVLACCTANGRQPQPGWSKFLGDHRTRTGLTVNAYPNATLEEVLEALPIPAQMRAVAVRAESGPDAARAELRRQIEGPLRAEIQGNVLEAYSRAALPVGAHLFVHVPDDASHHEWLRSTLDEVTTALERPHPVTLNIAFTHRGLVSFGVSEDELGEFPQQFVEGMQAHARTALRDTGESDPQHWEQRPCLDFIVMLRTADEEILYEYCDYVRRNIEDLGMTVLDPPQFVHVLVRDEETIEPFGFVDGIGQPALEWSYSAPNRYLHPEQPRSKRGEFFLGYEDEDGAPEDWTMTPLAQNGTFLAYRKLQQHVDRFNEAIAALGGDKVAAKMVGRTKDGTPLAGGWVWRTVARRDDFSYRSDVDGYECPIGAHIRRANPRDSLDTKWLRAARHRMIRRGVPYQEPDTVGTVFMAYCAHLDRQFEFVQGEWLKSGHVFGLGDEQDPLTGSGVFVIPGEESLAVTLGSFVTTRWGEYLFQPSKTGLGYLAGLTRDAANAARLNSGETRPLPEAIREPTGNEPGLRV
jgi:Dyp-type peroxidase family